MQDQIILQTERLVLKSITPAIINELFNTKIKEEIIAYFGLDENGYLHYKDMHENGMTTHRISIFVFLLIEKQTNLPIGDCGFHTLNKTHRRTEVFYQLRKDEHKRKGLMTEALKAVLHYGYTALDLHRIEALVDPNNVASVKLLKHYGFMKEGTMRQDYLVNGINEDSDCYSLLKHEWEKLQH
jgi:[ribosomal protein S5]-alanine N-acetyltransferase